MIKKNILRLFLILLVIPFSQMSLYSQDDLMDMLDDEVEEEIDYTAYTFKSARIINMHSIEQMKTRELDFRINHRFGTVNSGAYEMFGLDNALINLCFDYGVTDWFMVGFRRGTYQKTYDGSLKFRILRQSKGLKVMPVTLSYYVDMSVNTLKITDPNIEDVFSNRLAYTHQLLIARKFSERLSLQLIPSFVHRNLVPDNEENDIYAIGIGGRYKFARRLALTFEYFYASNTAGDDKYYNPFSIGLDIETGGHVFQIFFTNAQAMVEKAVIAETTGNWLEGNFRFGFNMSRVFAFSKKSH